VSTLYSTETISFLKPRSVLFTLRTSCSIWKRSTRVASARNIALISSRAKCKPMQACGPEPNATCSAALRVTSNRCGSENLRSSRFWAPLAQWFIADPTANAASLATRDGCSVRKVNMTISLAFLAPDLVKAAVDGRLPHGMGVVRLTDPPAEWSRQHQMLGLPAQ